MRKNNKYILISPNIRGVLKKLMLKQHSYQICSDLLIVHIFYISDAFKVVNGLVIPSSSSKLTSWISFICCLLWQNSGEGNQ